MDLPHSSAATLEPSPHLDKTPELTVKPNQQTRNREALRKSLAKSSATVATPAEVEAHFQLMPPHYWETASLVDVVWHLETLHEFFGGLMDSDSPGIAPVVKWRHFPKKGFSEVIVCTWDRQGLFAKVAGSFTLAGINIIQADIHTREDHVVVDVFRVCDIHRHAVSNPSRMKAMAEALTRALDGKEEFSFSPFFEKERAPARSSGKAPATKITFDTTGSAEHTILKTQTRDCVGLLYYILQVLTHNGLNIAEARIQTRGTIASDEYFLTDAKGGKITDAARLKLIEAQLREMLDHLRVRSVAAG